MNKIENAVKKTHQEELSKLEKKNVSKKSQTQEIEMTNKESKKDETMEHDEESYNESESDDEEDEEEEEMPDEIKKLPEDRQQAAIIKMSCKIMLSGTLLVILFSDPMVGVLSAFGKVIGVPSF